MGSFFGGLLSREDDVTLVGRADHIAAIRAHGLRITGATTRIARPSVGTRVPKSARPDLILVATKAYDTEGAMRILRPFARSSLFLTLQNGLDNPFVISRTATRVLAGTTAHGVTFVSPGVIRHAGVGDTVLGVWKGASSTDLAVVRDRLEAAGVRTHLTRDVWTDLWAKLVVNAAINPVAALAGVPNGELARNPGLRAVLTSVAQEASAVARADGARLDGNEIGRRALRVARRTAKNRASMLQDLDRGHRTEIEGITGAVLRAADRYSLEVPLNRALYALVASRESMALRASRPFTAPRSTQRKGRQAVNLYKEVYKSRPSRPRRNSSSA